MTDDVESATWQPDLYGPGCQSLLTQRPLWEGGLDRSPKREKPRTDQPLLFEETDRDRDPTNRD